LQNLLNLAPSSNLNSMLVQKLLPLVKSFSTRKWSDDEVVDDIKFLKDELEERLENLT
jgi:V-type H+-transporting ATPase subunit H